ncbi:MAG: hypothetical protein GY810_02635 [Aureispira sp.]|nr:hypothetical protein [Aureispira sp.]
MNKTTVLILLAVAWCLSTINAQEQRPMHEWCYMQQKGMTFQAINALMEAKHQGKSSSKRSENYSREYKQYKRWATMWKSRVDADGNFVSPMHTYNEWLKIQKDTDLSRSSAGANWTSLGPSTLPTDTSVTYTGLGRLNAIAFEPGNNNTIWVGSPSGGLWKSTTGGSAWSPMTDGLPVMGISDIVIDHSNVNTMYIATGDADGQHTPSIGVMKSTNGGATWATTGLNFMKDSTFQVPHMVMHPSTSATLLATSSKGIYKTTNGGTTWTLVHTGKTHAIMYGAGSSTVMYATADGGYDAQWNVISAKILKSTNGGDTWADITPTAIQNSNSEKVEIAVTAADPNFLFAYGNDNTAVTSSNGGTTWSTMATFPTQFDAQGTYNTAIAIAPNNKNLLMIGGVNEWRSTNGGTTWEIYLDGYWSQGNPYFYVHSDHHMFKFMPGSNTIMFACHDGGVHKGDVTASTPWTDLSSGLGITQHYGLGLAGNNASVVIAGAQDNDAIRYTGSGTWATVFGPVDGIDGVVDYSSPTLIGYATKQEGDFVRTTDG